MVATTESKGGDASKQELDPGNDGHELSNDAMYPYNPCPYFSVHPPFQVQLQVYPYANLYNQEHHDSRDELRVDVGSKLTTLVLVSEEVS